MTNISCAPSQMTKVKLLKLVLKRFKAKKNEYPFICHELRKVFEKQTGVSWGKQSWEDASSQLVDWIRTELKGQGTYESWVMRYHPEIGKVMDAGPVETKWHEGRVQWLEAMVEYWKAEAK